MNTNGYFPKSLIQAIRYFSDSDNCLHVMAKLRWPDGQAVCPRCESDSVRLISTRRVWECKSCRKQFSAKVGTVFEDSPIGLDKWLTATWLLVSAKNGISSCELARSLGVTQKTAWFMLHRIRLAMQTGTFLTITGEVEADETFIGGKALNMHKGRRKIKGSGAVGKEVVFGLLDRNSREVRTVHLPDRKHKTVQNEIRRHVEAGSELFTDNYHSYTGLNEYAHQVIDHAEMYARGKVHTNGLENFWSLLKRCIKGTYVSVMPFHLYRYLDEQTFRFNNRRGDDAERFTKTLKAISGKRLTYKKLIAED